MSNSAFTVNQINSLLKVKESYKAPGVLLKILFNKNKREALFRDFLDINHDVSLDWFSEYYQKEISEKDKNQDLTPHQLSELLAKLVNSGSENEPSDTSTNLDIGAGTGSLTISKWREDCLNSGFFTYKPHEHLYYCEELSDKAIPFLLFNMAIRGINCVVFHGDSFTRKCKGVFLIENQDDEYISFSDINLMPYNDEAKAYFNVNQWDNLDSFGNKIYPEHVETEFDDWVYSIRAAERRDRELKERFVKAFQQLKDHQQ